MVGRLRGGWARVKSFRVREGGASSGDGEIHLQVASRGVGRSHVVGCSEREPMTRCRQCGPKNHPSVFHTDAVFRTFSGVDGDDLLC